MRRQLGHQGLVQSSKCRVLLTGFFFRIVVFSFIVKGIVKRHELNIIQTIGNGFVGKGINK